MSLEKRDKKHLWHPLTQHKTHPNTLAIRKAKGAMIIDEEGRSYIDGIASWYTCMYGHCNNYIIEKVSEQMQILDHVVFTGFTHEPAVALSEALIEILPKNQEKLFFSDNGSTSVDVAIKMALQYHFNRGGNKRHIILALEDGFHGDTFGAMSVSGLSVYNGPFEAFFIDVKRIPVPTASNLEKVKTQLQQILSEDNVAAFIFEPLVQGAAAMKMHEAEHLDHLLQMTSDNGVINIADEVMTGFGKTGTYFASDQLKVKPDIMCLSKSLTGGVSAMAITSCTQLVYDAFYDESILKGFFHGHTYSANPLTCTAAKACIDLLISDEIQLSIQRINDKHHLFAASLNNHEAVQAFRICGVICAVELNIQTDRYGGYRDRMFSEFMNRGVFLRPLGNVIYILPPFVITDAELDKIYQSITEVIDMMPIMMTNEE